MRERGQSSTRCQSMMDSLRDTSPRILTASWRFVHLDIKASFISTCQQGLLNETHILMRQGTNLSRNEILLFRFITRPQCGMMRLRAMSSTFTAASPRPRSRTSRLCTTLMLSTSSCSLEGLPRTSSPWTTGRPKT